MGYNEQYALVVDENFKGRVSMALVGIAAFTKLENSGVANYTQRQLYANAILNNPTSFVNAYIYRVAAHAPIVAEGPIFSRDSDIDYIVAVIFPVKALEYVSGV